MFVVADLSQISDTPSFPDPPSNLSITGYTAGTSLRAGEYKKLDCVATGGNPVANLQWFKGEGKLIY